MSILSKFFWFIASAGFILCLALLISSMLAHFVGGNILIFELLRDWKYVPFWVLFPLIFPIQFFTVFALKRVIGPEANRNLLELWRDECPPWVTYLNIGVVVHMVLWGIAGKVGNNFFFDAGSEYSDLFTFFGLLSLQMMFYSFNATILIGVINNVD